MSSPQTDPRHDWLRDLPLRPGPPELRLGTRALDLDTWLAPDTETDEQLRLRAALLAAHDGLVRIVDGHDALVEELSGLLSIHLQRPVGTAIGDVEATTGLIDIAKAIQDDIFLLAPTTTGWTLVAGALVFPNHWSLDDKIGKHMASIHQPVDGYAELLDARVDRFFDRLAPGRPVWRRNWFVHDEPDLFAPDPVEARPIDQLDEVPSLWIRSEFQTLNRLAFGDAIVFTVRTHVAPFDAVTARPDVADAMLTFIESAGPRTLDTTHLVGRHRAIADYLWRTLRESSG